MKPPRWPVLLLPALLCAALADGYRPAQTVFPKISLNTSLLRIGPPHVAIVPSRTLADRDVYPAYLDARFSPSPVLPGPEVNQAALFSPFHYPAPEAQLQVLSVTTLLTAKPGDGSNLRRKCIEALRAINAGTLNPVTLTPFHRHALGTPAPSLPYIMSDHLSQATAGAVKKMVLPGGIRGIRYLVIRAGDIGYLPAEATAYTFQGLSADGKFYVAFSAPVLPSGIKTTAQILKNYPYWQYQPFTSSSYGPYTESLQEQLDANSRSAQVLLLDSVIQSLRLR